MTPRQGSDGGEKWFERYLPFVARGPEARVRWLVNAISRFLRDRQDGRGDTMSPDEMGAYIRILLGNESLGIADYHRRGFAVSEEVERIAPFFKDIPSDIVEAMVRCADIYDVPDLFRLISSPTRGQVEMALRKVPPAYEKSPARIVDRVFHAVYRQSPLLLEEVAAEISDDPDAPEGFVEAHERFMEIIKDEQILGELFPRAVQEKNRQG